MLACYAIVRYVIVKPLRHLRDVSDAVTRGNMLRAEIHTGDEFEELSTAFNRMLRTLITIQDELRQANVNLDGKVDELAQVNMRLYEMNMIKSDFLATMSHELRTPLNSILGFSEVLAGIEAIDDKQKRYVQNIQKSGKTLAGNDQRHPRPGQDGERTDGDPPHRFPPAADRRRPGRHGPAVGRKEEHRLGNRDRARPAAHAAGPGPRAADSQQPALQCHQVHARRRASHDHRRSRRGDYLVLRVIDTGVGIAEEDQQVIFEKFRQGRVGLPGNDAMTREFSGSGLGLSIVKELCKLLGGEVSGPASWARAARSPSASPGPSASRSRPTPQGTPNLPGRGSSDNAGSGEREAEMGRSRNALLLPTPLVP